MANSTKVIYTSNAKINLGLQVLNKREDGYHNIHSLFIEVRLGDELIFSPSNHFTLTTEGISIPLDDSNLITQAYKLLQSKAGNISSEYTIHVKKHIPPGGGLGGGSSNAAATLKTLNQLWNLNQSQEELEVLAKSLGSDVPFFIQGGVQIVEGIGDILTPIDPAPLKDYYYLLVIPPIHISTVWAYGELNKSLVPDINHLKFAPLSKPMKWELFDNDFERVIRKTYPEIGEIKEKLLKNGAIFASLSGSGSTVFGVFDNHDKAEALMENFSPYQTFLSSPVYRF